MVVFGYPAGRLANPTFRAYKRARRATRSRNLDVRVELRPFGDLPPVVEILVVDEPVRPEATAGIAVQATIVAAADRSPGELELYLDGLVERGIIGSAPAPSRTIAVHRGVEPLTERARVTDPG
jgi:hypothetical protein